MYYRSLRGKALPVSFAEATLRGQAPDGGLYFPVAIPALSPKELLSLRTADAADLAFCILQPYVGDAMPENVLRSIAADTVNFPFPLVKLSDTLYALELFHGPTLAFKDVGARFMSRCLSYFNRHASTPTTVLVATSGDTGGAVAQGFLGAEGVQVIILYPSGRVSQVQELQLTTCGQNITALEIEGSFDDCQRMVKAAFLQTELVAARGLTSANSINVARWLPQQLYYFFAWQQWAGNALPLVSVPSGNFGNLAAGMLALVAGLPVHGFVAACNANNTVPTYLQTGTYVTQPAVATLSNAMDVADPSNLVRLLELFGQDIAQLKSRLQAISISDEQTAYTVRCLQTDYNYLADPHGAVAAAALHQLLAPGEPGLFLQTAHPIKFAPALEAITGKPVPMPDGLAPLLQKQKQAITMPAHEAALLEYLWHLN